jgi:hypothetical protein
MSPWRDVIIFAWLEAELTPGLSLEFCGTIKTDLKILVIAAPSDPLKHLTASSYSPTSVTASVPP